MTSSAPSARRPNRLIHEASAYLRQHAHNPVDWYPWGEEALARARELDRPILLSVGYSACHWCHVMERESFEDEAVARQMNDHFVCIKVDREERPDIDQIYQTVVQLLRQSGGWPLTVFLTPTQRPFFGGTYFPPAPRHGLPAFGDLLGKVAEAYAQKREDVLLEADEIMEAITRVNGRRGTSSAPGPELLGQAAQKLTRRFDDEHGGFGDRPKFPSTMNVEVLLRHAVEARDGASEARVRRVLDAMRAGGIWDHLGGGFHRYSTDAKWLVPHFEKMLYDNAQLLRLYLDAGRAFASDAYVGVARDIAVYLRREMQSPAGAFFAAQDADSEGEEGRFFVWSPAQIDAIVTDPVSQQLVKEHYGVEPHGNFEKTGLSVLSEVTGSDRLSIRFGMSPSEVHRRLDEGRAALWQAREQRPRPARDEKMLACWNGLTIGALAELGAATGETVWIDAARAAFACLEQHLIGDDKTVARYLAIEGGQARVLRPGFLDDHANLGLAALDLYEATGEARYAQVARRIADRMLADFWADGSFYLTAGSGESLVVRPHDPHDQATPSGSSQAALLCLRLGSLVGEPYTERAATALGAVAASAIEHPFGLGQSVNALHRLVRGSVDVVIVGTRGEAATEALRREVLAAYLPSRTLVLVDDDASRQAASALAEGKPGVDGGAVAYVCRGQTCSAPVRSADELRALLREGR